MADHVPRPFDPDHLIPFGLRPDELARAVERALAAPRRPAAPPAGLADLYALWDDDWWAAYDDDDGDAWDDDDERGPADQRCREPGDEVREIVVEASAPRPTSPGRKA